MKKRGEKIAALTAYDYPMTKLLDECGVPLLLVGDSVGMVVLGYPDTTLVTIDDMRHHTRAVARACATNRVAVVVPCHRVVGASGALAGAAMHPP